MNFEEAQRLTSLRLSKNKSDSEALSRKKLEITERLKTNSIFKDMLEGRLDTYEKCINHIYLKEIIPNIRGSSDINYLSGFKAGIEFLGKAYDAYYKDLEDYNKIIERDK